jgi:metallo-beta-lactamase family protein
MTVTLTSLGGAGTVTGSKHLLEAAGRKLLLDCGLFQGLKHLRERNWEPLSVPPAEIDAVVLSHAHLDHCGYLPRLVKDGYRGDIVSTAPTEALAEIILKDSGQLQEKDAEFANRHGFSKHRPALPLYTLHEAERAMKRFAPAEFGQSVPLPGGATALFRNAGHILGAATVEIGWKGLKIVFSGDLGRYDDPVMWDPEPVAEADYLLVESTYGDRLHPKIDPKEALAEVVERTTARGGAVVIPAFAVGRAQMLLYHLWRLKSEGRLRLVPIYLDSPMAIAASDLSRRFVEHQRLPPDVCRQVCDVAEYVHDVEQSKAVTASHGPKVIVAASGMATGGRVLHHLKAFGPDHRNTILFSGYQAPGTRGASLLGGAREVKIHGQWVPIRAEVAELPMLSAHADADEILRWLKGFRRAPRRTFIVHGEPSAAEALRVRIGRELGWAAAVSEPGRPYGLK